MEIKAKDISGFLPPEQVSLSGQQSEITAMCEGFNHALDFIKDKVLVIRKCLKCKGTGGLDIDSVEVTCLDCSGEGITVKVKE